MYHKNYQHMISKYFNTITSFKDMLTVLNLKLQPGS